MNYWSMKVFIKTIVFILISGAVFAQEQPDCYTITAGKDASFDGSVLVGHNEDDSGEMLVNWFKVPARKYKNDSTTLLNGTQIKQVNKTNSYLRFQVTGEKFGDAYLNEHSLVICSNACKSKEDTATGNIGCYFRRILAERAGNAKEAVKLGGKLIEEHGYESSGRTYCIADKNEAWVLAVVKGKHWIAQRIPDNQVAIIPNYYTIQKVDLKDTLNFLSSPDIIEYAIKRGWYDTQKEFNFREVYGDSLTNIGEWNIPRHLSGLNHFQDNHFSKNDILPFSFKPEKKVTLEDIKSILSNHHEKTDYYNLPANNNPHENNVRPVCTKSTQFSFIAQLRSNMPNEIGSLMWICPYNGCINPYIPIYLCIKNTHESYRLSTVEACEDIHFQNDKNNLKDYPNHAYYIFAKYIDFIESNYPKRIEEAKKFKIKIENELKSNQNKLEKSALEVYESYPDDVKKILTPYCNSFFQRVLKHSQNE